MFCSQSQTFFIGSQWNSQGMISRQSRITRHIGPCTSELRPLNCRKLTILVMSDLLVKQFSTDPITTEITIKLMGVFYVSLALLLKIVTFVHVLVLAWLFQTNFINGPALKSLFLFVKNLLVSVELFINIISGQDFIIKDNSNICRPNFNCYTLLIFQILPILLLLFPLNCLKYVKYWIEMCLIYIW